MLKKLVFLIGASALATSAAAAGSGADPATLFGARQGVTDISLSPDGTKVAFVAPGPGAASVLYVATIGATEPPKQVTAASGESIDFNGCNWADDDRLICGFWGLAKSQYGDFTFTRMVAIGLDGGSARQLGQRTNGSEVRIHQYDGGVIDWLGQDGSILMTRDYVPQRDIGTRLAQTNDGLGVDRVDVHSFRTTTVEPADRTAMSYMSDRHGHVRIKRVELGRDATGQWSGESAYYYRTREDDDWKELGERDSDARTGIIPLAIDAGCDCVYTLMPKDGRLALFRIALDGSKRTELVYANPDVDVDDVLTVGRGGPVIGVTYADDRRQVIYFDKQYEALAQSLSRALPNLPLIYFVDASRDGSKLLIFAGSDVDPGRYYLFDRGAKKLAEIMVVRPQLEGAALAPMKPIRYRSSDGVEIPAYLTLPPGSDGKRLPAIVMPHGGPGARDEWGFDWLAQYFASRGYAVLQPNFRGSAGYGSEWFAENGFRSWRLAIGDVTEAGHWLVQQGIAAPDKLAIFGWSYGGYAALQSNVVAPDLFKAVVAVAPVTDFKLLKEQYVFTTAHESVSEFVGDDGEAGSPARHADAFKAPVLLFHGTEDLNVDVKHSREMASELRDSGKQVDYVEYPGLFHDLGDAKSRTDMLTRSDRFLRTALGIQ